MALREDLSHVEVTEIDGVKLPADFWEFWSYYYRYPQHQGQIERAFADFPLYFRLLQKVNNLKKRN